MRKDKKWLIVYVCKLMTFSFKVHLLKQTVLVHICLFFMIHITFTMLLRRVFYNVDV